jgi:hypothetical protein
MGTLPRILFNSSAEYLKHPANYGQFPVIPEAMSPKAIDYYERVNAFINEVNSKQTIWKQHSIFRK